MLLKWRDKWGNVAKNGVKKNDFVVLGSLRMTKKTGFWKLFGNFVSFRKCRV